MSFPALLIVLSIGNLTYIDVDFTSLYSISASASAVSQSVHQYTGFLPLYIYPI